MAIRTTYTKARANFAQLCNRVSENKDVVYITRRNAEDVALISESELSSLLETAHLLQSPKNAQRLLRALNRALSGKGSPSSLEELKREVGFNKEKS